MHKILYINLNEKTQEVKTSLDMKDLMGGIGIGLKLLQDNIEQEPIVFSVGPLNGYFPFVSKTSVVFYDSGAVEDFYLGGSLSTRIKFAGLDAVVILGKSKEPTIIDITDEEVTFRPIETEIESLGLPGKKATLAPLKNKYFLDNYFLTADGVFDEKLAKKNVAGLVITGTKSFEIQNKEKYDELYYKILTRIKDLDVEMSTFPSCSGCPMGCSRSRTGEVGGNVLLHSLVACAFAESIYTDIGVVFSCLNTLGYDYTHEMIENQPKRVKEVLKNL